MKKIEELKRLLIVVDMVNGFIKEGAMADSSINNITSNIVNTIGEFMSKRDAQVAFIKDTHELGCQEFKRYPVHCVKGTSEAELIDELIRFEKDSLVYEKNSTSTMFAPNFMNDINYKKKTLLQLLLQPLLPVLFLQTIPKDIRHYAQTLQS